MRLSFDEKSAPVLCPPSGFLRLVALDDGLLVVTGLLLGALHEEVSERPRYFGDLLVLTED